MKIPEENLHVIIVTDGDATAYPEEDAKREPLYNIGCERDEEGHITDYWFINNDNAKISGKQCTNNTEAAEATRKTQVLANEILSDPEYHNYNLTAIQYGKGTLDNSILRDSGTYDYKAVVADGSFELDMVGAFQSVQARFKKSVPWIVTVPMGEDIDYKGPTAEENSTVEIMDRTLVWDEETGAYVDAEDRDDAVTTRTLTWNVSNTKPVETITDEDGVTTFRYRLDYDIVLDNTETGFVPNSSLPINIPAVLRYTVRQLEDGNVAYEDRGYHIFFETPEVEGYIAGIKLHKVDDRGRNLAGAEFTLVGDDEYTTGQGKVWTAVSGKDGYVTVTVPSGHGYFLQETKAPKGYIAGQEEYFADVTFGTVNYGDPKVNEIRVVNQPENPSNRPYYPPDELTELPDEDPPLEELPAPEGTQTNTSLEVPDMDVPLAEIPDTDVPLVELPEDDVPLVDVPRTGDSADVWLCLAMLSMLGLACLRKKRRAQ